MDPWAHIILGDSRDMAEVAAGTIDLVVTSPPYWHLKDYGIPGQIGYGQSLHEYLKDLYRVWAECLRVLRPGGRLCVNIGDQFARAAVYGRYKVIPLHAEIIGQGESLGFDFLGSIIWQKKTTMNPTGGAVVMGSYPYPPNGVVEIDYEFILIFKKPGPPKRVSREVKEASRLTKEEWKEYFSGHWHFGGARQIGHEAMFPEELPRRLIRMFSFVGDTVLDPFLGSGTTVKVALDLGRNAIGYEINEGFLAVIREKLGLDVRPPLFSQVCIRKQEASLARQPLSEYKPHIKNANPRTVRVHDDGKRKNLRKVIGILDEKTLLLDDGQVIALFGIRILEAEKTVKYLKEYVLGRRVLMIYPNEGGGREGNKVYLYLKNGVFINRYLVRSGLALPDPSCPTPTRIISRSSGPAPK